MNITATTSRKVAAALLGVVVCTASGRTRDVKRLRV